MTTNARKGAALFAVALVASACGGSSEIEPDQAAVVDEVEAQVEEQTAEGEPEVVDEAEAAAEVEETTAEVEAVEGAEDEAPVVSEVSGAAGSDITPDEVAELVTAIVGPTDDLSSAMQQVFFGFPVLSARADTEVISVDIDFELDADDEWLGNGDLRFTTSESPENAVLAYRAELEALFPDGEVGDESLEPGISGQFEASVGPHTVTAFEFEEGVTLVDLFIQQVPSSPAQVEVISSLSTFAFGSEQRMPRDVSLQHLFRTTTIGFMVHEPVLPPEFEAGVADVAAERGWTFVETGDFGDEYEVDGVTPNGSVTAFQVLDDDFNPVTQVMTQFMYR